MRRGTTPTLKFNLSIPADLIASLNIAFSQNGKVVFEKTLKDCTIEENKILKLRLSQEDTLSLTALKYVEIQFRVVFVDGTADASDVITKFVDKILKDGVLK